jgi:hypothetical protein
VITANYSGSLKTGTNGFHEELYGLATNLIQIESGGKRFRDILGGYPDYYDNSRWGYYLGYFKQQNYKPMNCNNFCPYSDECNHSTNILSTVKPKRHSMEILPNFKEKLYSIEEVEEDVRKTIETAVDADDDSWHIIKAQTSVGKTEAYLGE